MSKPSSLTSIIVDLGFSAEEQVGEVQARQVIYGGDQETNLLELGLVSEEELLQALSSATGLPPAPSGYLEIDAALTERLPASTAACVAGYNEGGLPLVFTAETPSEKFRSELEGTIGDTVELLAAPQLRISEALASMERGKLSVRETGILEKLGPRPSNAPLVSAPPAPEDAETAVPPVVQATAPQAIAPPPPSSETLEIKEPSHRPLGAGVQHLQDNPPAPVVETAPPPEGYEEMATSSLHPPAAKGARPAPRHSYSIAEATSDLQGAKNRDRAIDVLVHYAAQFFEYTAVFAVLSKEAKGLRASGKGAPTETLKKLKIPLDLPSAFRDVKTSTGPKVARLKASGLEGGIARDLDRPTGREIFLLPVAVRGRSVLLLWGDRGEKHVALDSVAELISFAPIVSQTLERVLIEHKRASRVAQPMEHALPPVAPEAPPAIASGPQVTQPIVSGAAPQTRAPTTKRNPAAPAAQAPNTGRGDEEAPPSGHEVAQPHKRTLSQPRTPEERRESEPPMAFAEPPKTLRGFPEVKSLDQASHQFEARNSGISVKKPSVRPPLRSRRIVPLGQVTEVEEASEVPAEPQAPAPPVVQVHDPNDNNGQVAPPADRGTMMSRRPRISEPAESGWESPSAPKVQAVQAIQSDGTSPDAQSCADLVQALIAGDESVMERLIDEGDTAVGALIIEFPGPIREPESPSTPASQCGPILKALVELGSRSTPFLTVRTADSDAKVRRWATFLLGELPGKDSAKAIAGRLLDDSIDVRRAALNSARQARSDVLTRRTLRSQVEELCRDKSLAIESRCAAIEALADIREHEAIPTLLQLLDDKDVSLVRATRWALSVLTRQDFGADNNAWRDFWQAKRDQDRVEWLIESLDHQQRDLRRAAGEELKSLAGNDFGYSEDSSEAERHAAQASFRRWWTEEGKAASV